MKPQINSPNWCWENAGYRIERIPRPQKGAQKHRNIYDPNGDLILSNAGYEGEMEAIKALGLIENKS